MKRYSYREIAPDEILLDAHNLPEFDESRLEGRLERPITTRIYICIGAALLIVSVAFLFKLWALQVVEGAEYRELSENNRLHHSVVFAPRGVIYDRNETLLAWNAPLSVGTTTEEFYQRVYTDTPGLAHVLGYVSLPQKDSKGIFYKTEPEGVAGVEEAYDGTLAGQNGLKIVETDVFGEVLSESAIEEPQQGDSLSITIDAELQSAFYGYIRDLAEDVPFRGGAGVIMDIETGEIIALTSYPEYSANAMLEVDNERIAEYLTSSDTPFLNRIVAGQYTPGSIIKPYVALGALSEGVVRPYDTFVSTGVLRVENPYLPGQYTRFTDWKAHGVVDARRALAVSSNIYFYNIGGGYGAQEGLGITNIEKYARLFGFGAPTGVALAGEVEGVIPTPAWKHEIFDDDWRLGDTYLTAIGQYGFQVTPLQVVRAVAALANGGILHTPRIVHGEVPQATELSLDRASLQVVREGMRMAVTDGTARGLDTSYVAVAAKTGTAELGASKDYVHSWVTGYFPYDTPRYAFVVLMEHGPRANLYGGVFVMRQLLDWMRKERPEYLGIVPDTRSE